MDKETPVGAIWSKDAEEGLISAVVTGGNDLMDKAADVVREDWFFAPLHRMVWSTLRGMWSRRVPIDIMTLTQALREAGELDRIEQGAGWVTGLARTSAGFAQMEYWSDSVRDHWRRREVQRVASEMLIGAREFHVPTDDLIDESEKALLDLRLESKQAGLQHCAAAVDEAAARIEQAYENRGHPIGLATGFADLDRMTNGLRDGNLIIVAARPSMGKSAFATNVAEHVCLASKVPTALFSLEMTGCELMERVLCGQSGVRIQKVRDGFMSKDEVKRMGAVVAAVSGAPLYLDETPSLTIAAFRARARRAVAKHGVKFVIVDYLQLMKGSWLGWPAAGASMI